MKNKIYKAKIEVTGYLLVSSINTTVIVPLTKDTGEYFIIHPNACNNLETDLKYYVLPDIRNKYYNNDKRQYMIPPNTATTIKVKGKQSTTMHIKGAPADYIFKKKPTKKDIILFRTSIFSTNKNEK